MKRVILSALLVCITLASVCQLTKTEIANVINMSKEANVSNGVINPDKIKIGQHLTFLFADGTEKMIIAENGDSQWKILDQKIADLIAIHGQVIPYQPTPNTPDVKPSEEKDPVIAASAGKIDWDNFWVTLLIITIIVIIAVILYLAKKHKKEAQKDPVTSGPAMLPNGVTDENALAYATQVANRQFNNPNLQVREVQRGRLSGENLEVFYAGNVTPQRRTFTNQPAYRGLVNLNGADQFVYFLQGCGNDVRMGNYFTGQNIQFIADITATTLRPQPATTSTEVSPVQLTPQTLQVITAMAEVLKTKNSGSMIIEGNKVEVFFSTNNILFSANGHLKNISAIVAAPAEDKSA